jgi:hypothetical protein
LRRVREKRKDTNPLTIRGLREVFTIGARKSITEFLLIDGDLIDLLNH